MYREIDSRYSDGIRVTLYWDFADESGVITITDSDGTLTDIPTDSRAEAIEVYQHPFAYAVA